MIDKPDNTEVSELRQRFQKRRAGILANPEQVEDAQFVTPSSVSKNHAEARRLAREMLAARQSVPNPEKSDS